MTEQYWKLRKPGEAAAEIEWLQAKIKRWEAQSIAQYAEIKRLRELFWEYAHHHDYCEKPDGGPCGCGLEEAHHTLEPKP